MTTLRRRNALKAPFALALSALTPARGHASERKKELPTLVRDAKGILDLPEGFSYRVLQRFGERMSDGYRVPGNPDAMGCFAASDGSLVVMRNHEVGYGGDALSPYFEGQSRPVQAYDPNGMGGVTRLVLDPTTLAIKHSNLVLAGTFWNCAGGLSPWGWLSCEETTEHPLHGYAFLCATDAEKVRSPLRIAPYGRMRHEAASVDPRTLYAYLTEDRPDGCFYRFVPDKPTQPFHGTLQALSLKGQHGGFDTSLLERGQRLAVEWVDVEQPDSADDNVRFEAQSKGAVRIRRGEGLWLGDDAAYFCATAGGRLERGQIFRLTLKEPQTLEVVAVSDDPDVLDMPDNLCIAPDGQLFVAEDGLDGNFIRRVTPDGRVLPFAKNALSKSEFAGVCFAPDGNTLFANIQHDHLTLAIRGPFERLLLDDGAVRAAGAPQAHSGGCNPNLLRSARGLGTGLAVLALAALVHRRRARANSE